MGAGPTVGRIAIGASTYVLTSNGTDAAWAAIPTQTPDFSSDQNILNNAVFG
jgi:hypothetical protein